MPGLRRAGSAQVLSRSRSARQPVAVADRSGEGEVVSVDVALDVDLHLATVVHHRQRADLTRIGTFFATGRWDGEPYNAEPHKCGKLLWCDPSVLPSNTIGYPATGISSYLNGTAFTAHNW